MYKTHIIFLTLILNFKLFCAHIPREVAIAINKFHSIMEHESYSLEEPIEHNYLIRDNIALVNGEFSLSKFNKQYELWSWNQSNSAYQIEYNNYKVSIKKYSPRRKNCSAQFKAPQYKIWKYELKKENQIISTIFWTEKGEEPIQIVPVTLKDLEFLQDFMQLETVLEIFCNEEQLKSQGW